MTTIQDVTVSQMLASLAGTVCPACACRKKPRMSVCGDCWRLLPTRVAERLYLRVGHGYELAFRDAMYALIVKEIYLPEGTDARPDAIQS